MSARDSDFGVKSSALSVPRSASAPAAAAVDAAHPWLGLVSFTEETRAYFYGREEEVAELGRRVQRKLLTVLFGQSGLGKTSILQAGLVPRLRPEGFCPVYVRLDYDPHSPPPAEQIKRAVLRATQAAGHWTQTGSAVAGETLWEFLHHRDDVLRDANGRTLTPILIFDQFEEIFTLAQGDEAGRRRAQEFLTDLADLVENRPPASLEARIERDEVDAGRFDFARADYRILLSLREDYLAHLEGLKDRMPSVTQNRMRLARMTGLQALAAVRRPAPGLVSETVAEAIVRFVAGGASLEVAEVEPSLLSLICRELNNARLAQRHAEISADLLAGSRDSILAEFYERALVDQPPGVRVFIEDQMLTDSGFRESVGEERVRKGFAAAGAAEGTLAQLVDRRLLRAEDRLDQRRVEITHDVLCSVIAASRNVRRERETLAAKELELAAQREREAATRRALFRARLVAAVAIVLMIAAAGSAVFGWMNFRRAQEAERSAIAAEARAAELGRLANTARSEAEKIVGYLVDDFYRQLEPTGRVEIVAQLAGRASEYYRDLPSELRTPDTERNHGLTLARYGAALNTQNSTDEASVVLADAIEILQRLVREGDRSPETAAGLSLALRNQGLLLNNQQLVVQALATQEKSVAILQPFAAMPDASRKLRLDYADAELQLGLQSFRTGSDTEGRGMRHFLEARSFAERLLAESPRDAEARALLATVAIRQAAAFNSMGRSEDALRVAQEASTLYHEVLEANPGYLSAVNGLGIVHGMISNALNAQGKLAESLMAARQSETHYENAVRLNPRNGNAWQNLTSARERLANRLRAMGRLREANDALRAALEVEPHLTMSSSLAGSLSRYAANLAMGEAALGNEEAARRYAAETTRLFTRSARDEGEAGTARSITADLMTSLQQVIDLEKPEKVAAIFTESAAMVERSRALTANDDFARFWKSWMTIYASGNHHDAAVRLGRWAEAEQAARVMLQNRIEAGIRNDGDRADIAVFQSHLAIALARQGRRAEARDTLQPALEFFRQRLATHEENQFALANAARVRFAEALAQEADQAGQTRRRAALRETRMLMDRVSAELRGMPEIKLLLLWLTEAEVESLSGITLNR